MAGVTVTMILGQKSCAASTLLVTHSPVDLHAFVGFYCPRIWIYWVFSPSTLAVIANRKIISPRAAFAGGEAPSVPQHPKYIRERYGPDPCQANQTPATNQQAVRGDLRVKADTAT